MGYLSSKLCGYYNYWQTLAIAQFRVQYMANIFSYIADLFHEPLGEWFNSKIWEIQGARKIDSLLHGITRRTIRSYFGSMFIDNVQNICCLLIIYQGKGRKHIRINSF